MLAPAPAPSLVLISGDPGGLQVAPTLGLRAAFNSLGVIAGRRSLTRILQKNDLRVALFAAIFSGGVKAGTCALRHIFNLKPSLASLLGGAGAGLSLLIVPSTERRTFVLFTLVRAAEFLSRFGAISGHLPGWIVNFHFWDVLVMCLSAMQILFSYVACPHTLDPQYLRFLQQHGAKDPRALKAIEQWFRGLPWNMPEIEAMCRRAAISIPNRDTFVPCQLTHPGRGCWSHFFHYLPPVVHRSARLYLPIHALYGLYLLYSHRAKADLKYTVHLAVNVCRNFLRSCLFLSFYCATAWLMLCTTVTGFGTRSIPMGRYTQFFPGIALLFEHPARRLELALYCAPRAIDCAWNELQWHGYVRALPYADIVLFCTAASAIVYCHEHRREALRGTVRTLLTWLWHE